MPLKDMIEYIEAKESGKRSVSRLLDPQSTDSISSSYRQGKQQDDRKCNRENHLDKVCLGGRSSRPAPEETDGVCDEQQTTAFGELCTLTITADMVRTLPLAHHLYDV